MPKKREMNRSVQLTEVGLKRLHEARRRYKQSLNALMSDEETPSVNTIKRALRQDAVFMDTLERIWNFLGRCAEAKQETLPDLVYGEDYVSAGESGEWARVPEAEENGRQSRQKGWLSRSVPHPNRLFTGRHDILERLHASLKAGSVALVPDPQALTGLGGIGKTQTALAYIYAHRHDYKRVFWVGAETVESLDDGLAEFAGELNLLDKPSTAKSDAIRRIHAWFQQESDWLLVLDNADDLEILVPHFPRHHTGSLLLTTRARNTVKWASPLEIVKFSRNEGAVFLLRRAGLLDTKQALEEALSLDLQAALELSDALDGLPLALSQAGAYLAETHVSVADYLELYRSNGLELLNHSEDGDHQSVTVTFRLALEQIKGRVKEDGAAERLVRLCAFLAPDVIPEAILIMRSATATKEPQNEASMYGDEAYLAACAYSLMQRNAASKTLAIHRLVQTVIRESLGESERVYWAEQAVNAVSKATPDFEFGNWTECDLLLPHWRVCAEYIRDKQIETPQAAYLLYQAGRYLRARAVYDEAETYLCRAIEISEQIHGGKNRELADYLDDLACLYRTLDRSKEAETLHRRALGIVEAVKGVNHVLTASKLHNLAVFYIQYEDYSTAEALFLRALDIHERQDAPDHWLIATALTQLAGVYRVQKSFEQAEACCLRALNIYEQLLEPNHVDIATGCNNLALLYLTMEWYAEAESLYLRALAINEQTRGKDHPETGTVLWGLARVCWKQGRNHEANALFERATGIYTHHFGQEHVRSAKLLRSYAEFQEETLSVFNPSSPS